MSVSLKRVLLISADPTLLAVLRPALELAAPGVALSAGGPGTAPSSPDLIVLDARPPAEAASLIAALRQLPGCAKAPLVLLGAAGAAGAIGALPLPDDPAELAAALVGLWQGYQSRVLEEFIGQLTAEYILELPAILARVSSEWASLQRGWGTAERQQLQRLVHSVRGASASLGLHRLSAAARAVDVALSVDPGQAPLAEHVAGVGALFEDLHQAIAALCAGA